MSGFPDDTASLLSRALSLRLDRAHLIAGNIANADTPGFIPVEMSFEKILGQQLKTVSGSKTSELHMPMVSGPDTPPELYYDPTGVPGLDGNAVSLDREMSKLAENTVKYNATAQALRKKLAMLRYAISEGGAS